MLQISREKDRCQQDERIQLTKCLKDYVAKKVGCALNWFQNSTYSSCSKMDEYLLHLQIYINLFGSPYSKILSQTGCPKKCIYEKYKILRHLKEKISWNTTNWLSEFYIYSSYDNIEIRQVSTKVENISG